MMLGSPGALWAQEAGEYASTAEPGPTEGDGTATPAAETPVQPGEEVPPEERSPIDGVVGHIGIGYFTDFAPIGVRYWFTRDWALDVGVDGSFSSGSLDGFQVGADVGAVYAIAHYHYAVAIARLGVGYRINQIAGSSRQDVIANAFLGVELFLGALGFPNVSLQGGYGVEAAWTVEGGTNFVIGATEPSLDVVSAGTVGFHIYL